MKFTILPAGCKELEMLSFIEGVEHLQNISAHYQVLAHSDDDDDDDSDGSHDDWIISMYIELSECVVEILKLAIRTLFSWVNNVTRHTQKVVLLY